MRASINVIASFGAGAWSALLGLLVVPVYLRYLGVEAYGLIGFLLTLQAWFLLLDMGLSPTATREMARFSAGQHSARTIRDLFASMEWIYLLIALLLAAALVLGARWLATDWLRLRTLPVEAAARALALMAAMVGGQWMATLYRSAINGLQLQVWLGGLTFLAATARAAGTIAALAWIAPTLDVFILAQAAGFLLEALAMRLYLARRLPPVRGRFNVAVLRKVWRFAAGMTVIAVLATLLTQVDKLLLARLLTLDQFGYFSLAMAVVGALTLFVSPVFNAAGPRLAQLAAAGQSRQLADEYHAFSQIAAMVLLPVAATLALLAPQAVFAWTGDRQVTAQVAPLVAVWVAGTALNGVMHVPYALQLAVGWVRLTIALNVLGVAVMVPAVLVLVPRYGALAAGWIWLGLNLFYLVAGTTVLHRRVLRGEQSRWFLRDLAPPALAALVPLVICRLALSGWGPMDRVASGAMVALALLVAGISALAATPIGRKLAGAASGVLALRRA